MRVAAEVFGVGEDGEVGGAECLLCTRRKKIIKIRQYSEELYDTAKSPNSPISPATSASNPENTILHPSNSFGLHSTTTTSLTTPGIGVACFQFAASLYLLPALLGDAPRALITNHGCAANNVTKRCPTVPVAPSTPTGIDAGGGCCMPVRWWLWNLDAICGDLCGAEASSVMRIVRGL